MSALPGFGITAILTRWMGLDRSDVGMEGPLPPPAGRQNGKSGADPFDNMTQGMLGGIGGTLNQFSQEPQTRGDLYRIYDVMDRTDIAASVLDLYAEDSTQVDHETNRTIWVRSKDKGIVNAAHATLKRLNVEDGITGLARDLCKFGDDFERLIYRSWDASDKASSEEDAGVSRMIFVHPTEMARKSTRDGKVEGYTQVNKKFKNGTSTTSNAWDFVHFRLPSHDRRFPYGTSILKNAIRPWRQMMILEDWMVRYQVSRHPDRNAFLVDIGAAGESDGREMARNFSAKLKRHRVVDPTAVSGKSFDYEMNPITPDEDMVLALRKDSATRIEKLAGSGNAADIAPLDFVTKKFFASVRAPGSFFGFGSTTSGGGDITRKASLTTQDITYARGCEKVQKALRNGYQWLLEFNFWLKMGNNPEATKFDFTQAGKEFTVHMAPISFLRELERLEVMQIRQQVGVALADMGRDNPAYRASEWTKYILRDIIRIPQTELARVLRDADEVIAAQGAILNAKPVDVHTALPAGVGNQAMIARKQLDMQGDQMDMQADQQKHQQKMDKAQLRQAQEAAEDLVKRGEDAAAAARARGVQSDGRLDAKDMQLLSEVLHTNVELRKLIEKGVLLWRDTDEETGADAIVETYGAVLPDRKGDVFKKGPLRDEVTAEDLAEMTEEAIEETERAGT